MSKTFRKFLVILLVLTVTMAFSGMSAFADGSESSSELPDGEYKLVDGAYSLTKEGGGSIKNPLTCEKIIIENGEATGYFTTTSKSMSHIYLGERSNDGEVTDLYDPETGKIGDNVFSTSDIKEEETVVGKEVDHIDNSVLCDQLPAKPGKEAERLGSDTHFVFVDVLHAVDKRTQRLTESNDVK